jgi:hypothetical protein
MPDFYAIANQLLINPRDESLGAFRTPYLVFNTLEALCWLACALFVWIRYARHRKTRAELAYGFAFLAFALSDLLETSGTSLLLLAFKGTGLLSILAYRSTIRPLYGSRII